MSSSVPSDPPPPLGASQPPEGQRPALPEEPLAGKYRIERVVGQGGMGVVVAAWHIELEQRVAIKYLHDSALKDKVLVERFDREARAAVKIKSRHVARVSDVGKLASGSPYMVMEFLEGRDLQQLLADEGPQPIARAVDIVLEAGEAIAEAHALGIVHRDLKPANLFLADQSDGTVEVKVLDFGISKNIAGIDPSISAKGALTTATAVLGSPMYMSPEQLTSTAKVDTRTDIWSLGIILYELLAGSAPFCTGSLAEVWSAILNSPVPSPSKRREGLPSGLVDAVMRALAKPVDRRFATVADFASAIAPFGSGDATRCVERARRFARVLPRAGSNPAFPASDIADTVVAVTHAAPPPPRSSSKGKLALDESGSREGLDAKSADARPLRSSAPSSLTTTDWQTMDLPSRSRGTGWMVAVGVLVGLGAPAWFWRNDIKAFVAPDHGAATTPRPEARSATPRGDAPPVTPVSADPDAAVGTSSGLPPPRPVVSATTASTSVATAAASARPGAPSTVAKGSRPSPITESHVAAPPPPPTSPPPPPPDPMANPD